MERDCPPLGLKCGFTQASATNLLGSTYLRLLLVFSPVAPCSLPSAPLSSYADYSDKQCVEIWLNPPLLRVQRWVCTSFALSC